jgi:signal transduction histidine kinase
MMEREVILAATLTLITLVVIIIIFFVIFQSKKNQFILARIEAEKRLADELAKSKMEIREQGLKNVSWELYDHVGQLLSIAKLQLSMLQPRLSEDDRQYVEEVNNLIGASLKEIRLLSKTLSPEALGAAGLIKSINLELQRFNRLKFLDANMTIIGEETLLEQEEEIILFRILQEFFLYVVKQSGASKLQVTLRYHADSLLIDAYHNGTRGVLGTSSLDNMQRRASLIGATYDLETSPNRGVHLSLGYTFKKTAHA